MFKDVLRIEEVAQLNADGNTRQIISQLPSITILAFLLGNNWLLRAWHTPIRAGAIHLATIVIILFVPKLARGAIASVVAIKAVLMVKPYHHFDRAKPVRSLLPAVGLLDMTATITLGPWVYALSGDYWTSYETQWGMIKILATT